MCHQTFKNKQFWFDFVLSQVKDTVFVKICQQTSIWLLSLLSDWMIAISCSNSWSKPRPLQSFSSKLSKPAETKGTLWPFNHTLSPVEGFYSWLWPLNFSRSGWRRSPNCLAMRSISLMEAPPTAESELSANWPTVSLSSSRTELLLISERKFLQIKKYTFCGIYWSFVLCSCA